MSKAAGEDGALPHGVDGELEFQYVAGQGRATYLALFEEYRAACSHAESLDGWTWDVPYGPHARETMDLRPASADRRGTLIYLHAGYWQSRDKSQFRFIAPALNEAGFDVALANYPLCPEVSIGEIVDSVSRLPAAVRAALPPEAASAPLIVAGHSAGAHLAVEMVVQPLRTGGGSAGVDGILGISGVYDLVPLIVTTLNAKLRLDEPAAVRFSPRLHLRGPLPPAAFVVGGQETCAFLQQTRDMAHAWRTFAACQLAAVAGEDHFTVLQSLCAPDGLLRSLLLELARSTHRSSFVNSNQ